MTKDEKVTYWITSAGHDWTVAGHLFEKEDYPYALFFGHLSVEKILKAIFVNRTDEIPPFTHRLPFLAEKASLKLTTEQLELLEIVTDFNLEARYPDEKFSFRQRCSREFTDNYLKKIGEMREWLLLQIQQLRS